jgi:hypothetical protein
MRQLISFVLILFHAAAASAQGLNPITPGSSDLFQVITPAQANRSNNRTTAAGVGGSSGITTVAALRAANITYPIVQLLGYYTGSSFGAGPLNYVPTDTRSADNGCTIFVDSAGHRYYRNANIVSLSVMDCGAKFDDATDDSAALNAAFALGIQTFPSSKTTLIKSGLSLNAFIVGLNCNGSMIDATQMASGTAISISATPSSNPNTLGLHVTPHPMVDCQVNGPVSYPSGVNGITFIPTVISTTPWFHGMVFDRVTGSGFDNFYVTTDGSFKVHWNDNFYVGSGVFLKFAGTTNTFEEAQITNSFIANSLGFIWDSAGNPNTDIYVSKTSCDFTTYCVTGGATTPGTFPAFASVRWDGWHIEAGTWTDYVLNTATSITLINGVWVKDAGTSTHALCNISYRSGAESGVVLRDANFNWTPGSSISTDYFCDGQGRFISTGASYLGTTAVPVFAIGNNLIPAFDNLSISNWNITGGAVTISTNPIPAAITLTGTLDGTTNVITSPSTNPVSNGVKTGMKITGTGIPANTTVMAVTATTIMLSANTTAAGSGVSLTINATTNTLQMIGTGGNQDAHIFAPCSPGRTVFAQYYLKAALTGTGSTFGDTLQFADALGNLIGSGSTSTYAADITSFARERHFFASYIAPPGTAQIYWDFFLPSGTGAQVNIARPMLVCQ